MNIKKVSGIYKITNVQTHKKYVGSSMQIGVRWAQHKMQLRRKTHSNVYLQRAWDKYGEDSFVFEIVEECEKDKQILKAREQHYFEKLAPEYNMVKTAHRPPLISELPPEKQAQIKEAQSVAASKRIKEGTFGNKPKPVIATNLKNGEQKTYESAHAAQKDGFNQRSISQVCLGKKASHKGWRWEYADGSSPPNECKAYLTDVTFIQIAADGSEQEFANSKALKMAGFDPDKVRQVCKGERGRRSHKGYKWRFKGSDSQEFFGDRQYKTFEQTFCKAVVSYNLESGKIVKQYLSQASTKEDGFDSRKVSACCNGKRRSHGGLGWKFA